MTHESSSLSPVARYALALTIPLLVYLPTLQGGFLWDDWNNLVLAPRLQSWEGVWGSFLHHAMWSADNDAGPVATYRPLALASMALTHMTIGGSPLAHHAVSVLLHLATVAMVLRALTGLLPSRDLALAATLLWAVHPTNAEAVAWINGRSEIFAAFGIAWAMDASRRGRTWEVAAAVLFALLGKETGIVAMPAAILVRAIVLRRPFADVFAISTGVIAGGAAWWTLRARAIGDASMQADSMLSEGLPWVPSILALGLEGMLVPIRRGVLVVRDAVLLTDPSLQLVHIVATSLLLLVLAAALRRRQAALPVTFLLLWLASLAPPMALVATGWAGFGRWLYVMGWGFIAALALTARSVVGAAAAAEGPRSVMGQHPAEDESDDAHDTAWTTRSRLPLSRRAWVGVGALVALLSALSLRANAAYSNDAALALATIEDYPDQVFGYEMLAAEAMRVGHYAEAVELIDHAMRWEDQRSRMQFPGSMRAFSLARIDRCNEAAAALQSEFAAWHPRRHGLSLVELRECYARTGNEAMAAQLDAAIRDEVAAGRVLPEQLRERDRRED